MLKTPSETSSSQAGPLATSPAPAETEAQPGKAARPDADALLALVTAKLDEDKSEEIVSIDLRGKTAIADFMVIASGRSQRHVGAIADHLLEALKAAGVKGVRVEGQPACDWVLIDAGDVIIHIFQPEVRTFYNIEKMWSAPARA